MEILLVEDNILNQKIVLFNLIKQDYKITAVITGEEALEKYKSQKFDLILMDLMLPGLNGFEVTAEIRKLEQKENVEKTIPIIALTANTYDNDREKCLAAGMNDYLAKPFTGPQLIGKIENFR